MSSDQNSSRDPNHHQTTLDWIMQKPKFKSWLTRTDPDSLFWIRAKPGTGKANIARTIARTIEENLKSSYSLSAITNTHKLFCFFSCAGRHRSVCVITSQGVDDKGARLRHGFEDEGVDAKVIDQDILRSVLLYISTWYWIASTNSAIKSIGRIVHTTFDVACILSRRVYPRIPTALRFKLRAEIDSLPVFGGPDTDTAVSLFNLDDRVTLQAGADVNVPDRDRFGCTALRAACSAPPISSEQQHRNLRMDFLEAGFDVDAGPARTEEITPLLQAAAESANSDMVKLLLCGQRMQKITAWQAATQRENSDIVKLLPCRQPMDFEVISYCFGRQGRKDHHDFVATDDDCKDAPYTSQEELCQRSYHGSLEYVTDCDSPNTAACSKYRGLLGFPRYCRLRGVLERFTIPIVGLAYPKFVSAAVLPVKYWTCCFCNDSISPFSYTSLHVYRELTETIASAQLGGEMRPDVYVVLSWAPERQILQYLAFCCTASVLIYLQRTGPYLKYSFLVCNGLLALICACEGTETMLKSLPVVVMVTLLASWVCQVSIKIVRVLRWHDVQNRPAATAAYSPTLVSKANP